MRRNKSNSESAWLRLTLGILATSLAVWYGCGERESDVPDHEDLEITPDSAHIEVSGSQSFEVTFEGEEPAVRWYVDDALGGDPWGGMITMDGLYIAPDALPDGGRVTVRARALQDTSLEGTATVIITKTGETSFVEVSPETVTVTASSSVTFISTVSGCTSGDVFWSLELITGYTTAGPGEIESDGTYNAPATANETFQLLVRATSMDCTEKSGIAKVTVLAQPRGFLVELEDFTSAFDVPSSNPIQSIRCGSASSGYSVVGFDRTGEHIEVPVTVHGPGTYLVYAAYAAEPGDVIRVKVGFDGCGASETEANFTLDKGTGTG